MPGGESRQGWMRNPPPNLPQNRHSNGYFSPHFARSSSMSSTMRSESACGISGALLAPVENRVRRGGDLILVTGQLRRHIVMLRHAWSAPYTSIASMLLMLRHTTYPLSPQMQPARSEQASIDDVDTAITPLA